MSVGFFCKKFVVFLATDYKDLLTKACLTDNVEHFKILGYCVMPLFDEVLPRNGEYQLKVLNLLQVNEILGTRPRENSKIVTWPFSSWAIDVFKRDDSDGGRSSQCNLTIDFSISSQILMNEGSMKLHHILFFEKIISE